ncbi:hypothetical protein Hanom_Chr00s151652g01822181 [Helianthus anomalus]
MCNFSLYTLSLPSPPSISLDVVGDSSTPIFTDGEAHFFLKELATRPQIWLPIRQSCQRR